jgi:ZIP family zinc transporter
MIPTSIQAGLWGLLSGGALVVGAAIAYLAALPTRLVAGVMAFGSGVLISALSFELVRPAYQSGGFLAATAGFFIGALIYSAANWLLAHQGARHRKRSGDQQSNDAQTGGGGTAIAVGALIDGIPESIAIGLTLLHGGGVSIAAVVAIFISNLPEGLSSASGMKKAGRSAAYIFGLWISIAVVSGVAALLGYSLFKNFSPGVIAATTAMAAGAVMAMLVETMIPEAFEGTRHLAGLEACAGFVVACGITILGG